LGPRGGICLFCLPLLTKGFFVDRYDVGFFLSEFSSEFPYVSEHGRNIKGVTADVPQESN
jgi:hypothetical protein